MGAGCDTAGAGSRGSECKTDSLGERQLPRDTVHVSVMEGMYVQTFTVECRSGLGGQCP